MKFLEKTADFINSEKFESFKNFEELLLFYNAKFNLTTIKEEREIFIKHFEDSLYGESLFQKNKTVVEIGSGGGFPSVPLKLWREDLSFTLIEATKKKCDYLAEVKKQLNLSNFDIICGRCEEKAKSELRAKFDYAVARAVAPLNVLLEYMLPLIKLNGKLLCYKGSIEQLNEEINASKNALKILGGEITEIYGYSLNEFGERHIVEITKTAETPNKYPRGNGRERSKPL